MNEQELIKQLQALPKEVEAKNQWASLKAAIEDQEREQDSNQLQGLTPEKIAPEKQKPPRFAFPLAIAASALLVAFLSITLIKMPQTPELDIAQVKTIQSLQQASNLYYSVLGTKMQMQQDALPESLSNTLEDLRMAQKSYRQELSQNPHDQQLFKRLIRSYETERHLLQDLLG